MVNKLLLPLAYVILVLAISSDLFADDFQLFRISKVSGLMGVNTQYRYQETTFSNKNNEKYNAQIVTGLIELNIKSILWHPNFLQLDFGGNYNPGTRRDMFLVAPDRSELSSLESLKGKATFFSQRPLRLVFHANYTHNFFNRELTTNVESFRNNVGANFSIRNRFMPINVQWNNDKWRQYELATGRTFKSRLENLFVEINKSFTKFDVSKFKYNRRISHYQYADQKAFNNLLHELQFKENIYFDKNRMSGIFSNVWATKQTGSQPFERINLTETLNLNLPLNFKFKSGYRYNDSKFQSIKNVLHNLNTHLQHKLYKSLVSDVFYRYDKIKNTNYNESRKIIGGSLNYTKKIPGGVLNLNYEHLRRSTQRDNQSLLLQIYNEEHVLEDGSVVILAYPYVLVETIVVKDELGIIIYQENIDYILIERGDFIEIQRLPGGRIPSGATVLIDYNTEQNIEYDYSLKGNIYGGSLSLFKNLIRIYYRRNKSDFDKIDPLLLRILKWSDQKVIGVNFSYKQFDIGWEDDQFNTNIVPYRSKRYFASFTGRGGRDLTFIFSGNYRDYKLIQENEKQQFIDVNSRILYQFLRKTRLEINASYRKQIGQNLNLELWTGQVEWQTQFRNTWFKLGLEFYQRDFESEIIQYRNAYFRVERKF
ncbi:hypothetical protein [Caldithrix abyssi]